MHGTDCRVCGFSFESRYGDLGAGFVHVHYVVPLKDIRETYELDPARDLVPVCANCHAMLHRRDPPFTPEELRARLR